MKSKLDIERKDSYLGKGRNGTEVEVVHSGKRGGNV